MSPMTVRRPPLYWINETSGEMARIVKKFLNGDEMTRHEISTLAAYFEQWITSDAWDLNPSGDPEGQLAHLRATVRTLETRDGISRWLHAALDIGIDPL